MSSLVHRNSRSKLALAAGLAIGSALLLAPISGAQNKPSTPVPNRNTQSLPRQPGRTQQPQEYQAAPLDREVQLPNVPSYTGKQKFISGFIYPNAKQGPGYYLIYNTEHTESQVKDWWDNALSMDPWKVNFKDATTVKARARDGSTCSIVVMGPCYADKDQSKGMRGSYSIFYHVIQK